MARPTPVWPEVHSAIVPPGLSWPERSAASTIASAMRSLTLPPGLKVSSLASTGQGQPRVTRCNRTSGVFPMVSRMLSLYWTRSSTRLTWELRSPRDAEASFHGGLRAQRRQLGFLVSVIDVGLELREVEVRARARGVAGEAGRLRDLGAHRGERLVLRSHAVAV